MTTNQTLSATSPVRNYADFLELPKQHRENIVNKRLRAIGIKRGAKIPVIGDTVRTYSPHSTNVSTYTLTEIDYKQGTCEIDNILQGKKDTYISRISAHVVDADEITHAERDLVDRPAKDFIGNDEGFKAVRALKPKGISVSRRWQTLSEETRDVS